MGGNCVILLVEDDENDAFFVKKALSELGFPDKVLHFSDAEDVKIFLGGSAIEATPHLILADSAISFRESGVELLEWVRSNDRTKSTPFIILSGGVAETTRVRAERANVTKILEKTADRRALKDRLIAALTELPDSCRQWLSN